MKRNCEEYVHPKDLNYAEPYEAEDDDIHVCHGGHGCDGPPCACPCHYPRRYESEESLCSECGDETEDGLCLNPQCSAAQKDLESAQAGGKKRCRGQVGKKI
jgi:hypothetical protein